MQTFVMQKLSASSQLAAAAQQPASRRPAAAPMCAAFSSKGMQAGNVLAQSPAARYFGVSRTHRRASLQVLNAAQAEGVGKLISKVEIPAFIPRTDIVDQLLRWAIIEVQESGVANVGCPCKVRPDARSRQIPLTCPLAPSVPCVHPTSTPLAAFFNPQVTPYMFEDQLWGFTVSFLRDGASATDVRVAFDEEIITKHEWIGRGAGLLPRENTTPAWERNITPQSCASRFPPALPRPLTPTARRRSFFL